MINIPNEVKELFKRDGVRKNVRIHFVNGEMDDLTAANIDGENFSVTESLCSRDEFKFGLYENSVVNFTTLDVGNIKGAIVQIQHEIDISSLDEEPEGAEHPEDLDFPVYPIKYGIFKIEECTRLADSNARRIVGYSLEIETINEIESMKARIPYTNGTFSVDSTKFAYEILNADFPNKQEVTTTKGSMSMVSSKDSTMRYYVEGPVYHYSEGELLKIDIGKINKTLGESIDEALNTIVLECLKWFDYYKVDETYESVYERVKDLIFPFININTYYVYYKNGNIFYAKEPDPHVSGGNYYIRIPDTFTLQKNLNGRMLDLYVVKIRTTPGRIFRFVPDYTTPIMINIPMIKVATREYYIDADYIKENFNDIIEILGSNAIYNRENGYFLHDIETMQGLYPSESLYPGEHLYPSSNAVGIGRNLYYSIQYADEKTKPYGRVGLTYNGNNYVYKDIVSDYSGNVDNYNLYSLTENQLMQTIATSSLTNARNIMDNVANKIKKVRYTPATIRMKGLPYLQAGDLIEVSTATGAFETLILRRTLRGIQSLEDTIEARGE